MKVGLDLGAEKVFLEVGSGNGLNTTVTMTANTARALAGQLIASAEALEHSLAEGELGLADA